MKFSALDTYLKLKSTNRSQIAQLTGLAPTTLQRASTSDTEVINGRVLKALADVFDSTPGEVLDTLISIQQRGPEPEHSVQAEENIEGTMQLVEALVNAEQELGSIDVALRYDDTADQLGLREEKADPEKDRDDILKMLKDSSISYMLPEMCHEAYAEGYYRSYEQLTDDKVLADAANESFRTNSDKIAKQYDQCKEQLMWEK